jgi:carbamoyl-phosphate synthase large subunit
VLKTRICQDDRIIAEVKSIISVFRPCGPLTVQLIRDYESNEDYFIEINPRFGGGAPLSIKAGANSCIALLNLLDGQVVEYIEKAAEDNAVYSRFDQSIKVDYQG